MSNDDRSTLSISTMPYLPDAEVDKILALQMVVAWAGEALCEPPRLGWWKTDLIDEMGGGDLMARLLPKTHGGSSLELVRHAAIACDAQQRNRIAQPDTVRTLFYWGFSIDEQLTDRLHDHKVHRDSPQAILPFSLSAEFKHDDFTAWGKSQAKINYDTEPNGRKLTTTLQKEPVQRAKQLVAALFPCSEIYPMPFYRAGQEAE